VPCFQHTGADAPPRHIARLRFSITTDSIPRRCKGERAPDRPAQRLQFRFGCEMRWAHRRFPGVAAKISVKQETTKIKGLARCCTADIDSIISINRLATLLDSALDSKARCSQTIPNSGQDRRSQEAELSCATLAKHRLRWHFFLLWTVFYIASDPKTHWGAFFRKCHCGLVWSGGDSDCHPSIFMNKVSAESRKPPEAGSTRYGEC